MKKKYLLLSCSLLMSAFSMDKPIDVGFIITISNQSGVGLRFEAGAKDPKYFCSELEKIDEGTDAQFNFNSMANPNLLVYLKQVGNIKTYLKLKNKKGNFSVKVNEKEFFADGSASGMSEGLAVYSAGKLAHFMLIINADGHIQLYATLKPRQPYFKYEDTYFLSSKV